MNNNIGSLDEYIETNRGADSERYVKRGGSMRPMRGNRQMAARGRFQDNQEKSPIQTRIQNRNYEIVSKRYDNDRKTRHAPRGGYIQNRQKRQNYTMVEEVYDKKYSGKSSYQMKKEGIVPTLEVSGFAADIQNHQLNELFSTVGKLVKCKIEYDKLGNSRGMAFIKYDTFENTQTAYHHFHEAELDGKRLIISRKYSNKVNGFVNKRGVMGVARKNYFKTKRYDSDSNNRNERFADKR